jgi:hypothetical protein
MGLSQEEKARRSHSLLLWLAVLTLAVIVWAVMAIFAPQH